MVKAHAFVKGHVLNFYFFVVRHPDRYVLTLLVVRGVMVMMCIGMTVAKGIKISKCHCYIVIGSELGDNLMM
jgi:hypothetical protein